MITASILAFMGLGGQEMLLIFLALLLFFGAKKLPELARGLGKGIREFKDATKDVRENIEDGLKETK
ncbi:twin-arginine translocase TatA/TatE family subunit [Fibrella sp. HMF5335]|jgi:sec-independent protein translocase protein TatA|uniref:Sec-independent protein translocase protein TatA n=1 Tax=Fibrella rubiginis TaxID=2817060 RepID=A0A939G9K9_9BACT|nr:twin-arginine translocase TatA/TatE family subunit [Fibrella rubiginis]MBO0934977.1 twin-arginine translocase TatA/TatE family subunit [Fibrella rubiginis]